MARSEPPERDGLNARLRRMSLLAASCLEQIGLDLGIDFKSNIYLFEANLGNAAMYFHEFETAHYGISYALHLAAGPVVQTEN
ncbi:hypothetical protein [Paenibacillus sp. FSL E2-0178]|uniref:hypothetical protein n=1 Tax=Paenibacillus sp. FSL E2-0178 TaxID=2921361 RepID=UPI003158F278